MSHAATHAPGSVRARWRTAALVSLSALVASTLMGLPGAQASTVGTAAFTGSTGTATVGGTLYARSGAALTLTVTTSTDTKCVDVAGAFTGHQTSATARSSWTFATLAGSGDGARAVTVSASPSFNPQGACTGNTGSLGTSYVADNTGPVVSATLSPAANGDGWNKTSTDLTWTAVDAGSGVASGPTPSSSSETANGTVTRTSSATDRLGNSGNGSLTVRIDKVAPTITAAQTANPDGTTTVTFTCTDPNSGNASSGIASCVADGSSPASSSRTVAGGVTVTGTATDRAGNTGTASSTAPVRDTTPPTLSGSPTTSPNGAGWYAGDVTVAWTAADPESGILAAPGNTTITGEGVGLVSSQTVTNGVGLSTTANSSPAVGIDRTKPTTAIGGTSNGWVDGDVTVTLTPSDNLSGVVSTTYAVDSGAPQSGTSLTLSDEGVHVLTFSSTDAAGNAEDVQTATIRIDLTAPQISHAFTPLSYTDGAWTNRTVTVTFTCTDQGGSGVADCTSPVTASSEGIHVVDGTATDGAGNTATDRATVRIDTTAPLVGAVVSGLLNAAGWYSGPVTVTFSGSDALSGVSSVTPPFVVLGEGSGQGASATVTDAAGNTATDGVTGIDVDLTPPVLTASFPTGWQTGDVLVDWSCTDPLSGVATGPADETVTGEGANLSSSASCTDVAGNTTTETVTGIRIDRTPPTTLATVPDALASGWYGGPVTVTLSGNDNLSDVAATFYTVDGGPAQPYSGAFPFATEGTHTLAFWSVDGAGHAETPGAPLTLKVDTTAPVTDLIDPISPATGWFVTTGIPFAFEPSDGGAGVAATFYTIDGGNPETFGETFTAQLTAGRHTITYWSVDLAGNTESTHTTTIDIDPTAPTITGTAVPAPNGNGWNNSDVTVSFTADDGPLGSGVVSLTDPVVVGTESAARILTGTAQDAAGNSSSTTVTVRLDKTPPTVGGAVTSGAPNAAGWYRSPVTVGFICADALSGVDSCTAPVTLSTDGANRFADGTALDRAGNSASTRVSGINLDKVGPTARFSRTVGTALFGDPLTAPTCTAADSLSGPAGCTVTGFSTAVGTHTLTATARDNAGNVTTATQAYTVSPWTVRGFYSPIDLGTVVNTVKGGSTVPVKFELFAGTTELTSTADVVSLTVQSMTCKPSSLTDAIEATVATGGTALRYDATAGQFIFNWKTPAGAGKCYQLTMTARDGSTQTALFSMK